jgi:type I restriction enzyme S subunit
MHYIKGAFRENELLKTPKHWAIRRLGDVIRLKYGLRLDEADRTSKPTEQHIIPVYSSGGLLGYTKKPLVNIPTVILGRVGTIGKPRYVETPCYPIDTVFYVSSSLHLKYAYYLLNSLDYSHYAEYSVIPAIRKGTLSRIKLGIPPADEQEAIAKKLDTVVPALNDRIDNFEEQIKKCKELSHILIHQLLRGK